ncbi:glycosyltransferase [Mucilaginibacter arboris]|uniref:Glycosyltransferase family 1 protein n=1 Tax=Mucilaginibacter arboris TaxID=2682090 RepID=A0A7K1STI7_9SPHI|nr:glycosyltransferase family 1 protein [Mucilaginibacter arboris]MVN20623.1 glycosyltransferase family 1 protein [Mucilaginibacter arboris]
MLNIFYEEPDPDRWFPFDRYPRKIIRKVLRGKFRPGGVMMIALQLMKGLDKIGVSYRFNDYKFIKKNPLEIACIIGKPQVLDKYQWKNPILFGAGIFSHPSDQPSFFKKYPSVQKILVPGNWMKDMFDPYYSDKVSIWPAGIDTKYWFPEPKSNEFDFLIYNKIMWDKEIKTQILLKPILETLELQKLNYQIINYGFYNHEILRAKIRQSKAVIYLCEHETQGMAYQQILATNTPILAWDKGSFWEDPSYYPHTVQYEPVSSTPYWDKRCGLKFKSIEEFPSKLNLFLKLLSEKKFTPRSYITENLSLEISARKYLAIYQQVQQHLSQKFQQL